MRKNGWKTGLQVLMVIFAVMATVKTASGQNLRVVSSVTGSRYFYEGNGQLSYRSSPSVGGGERYYAASGKLLYYTQPSLPGTTRIYEASGKYAGVVASSVSGRNTLYGSGGQSLGYSSGNSTPGTVSFYSRSGSYLGAANRVGAGYFYRHDNTKEHRLDVPFLDTSRPKGTEKSAFKANTPGRFSRNG